MKSKKTTLERQQEREEKDPLDHLSKKQTRILDAFFLSAEDNESFFSHS
ncbi:MAG: hypothetical protein V1920_06405 [Bacillota bacterium]